MNLKVFANSISENNVPLEENQIFNIQKIVKICTKFHKENATNTPKVQQTVEQFSQLDNDDVIVIEIAHQPNVFPHSGLFIKAVVGHLLKEQIEKSGKHAICLFGLVNNDISYNRFLFMNRFPYTNTKKLTDGYRNTGFPIGKKDRNKVYTWHRTPRLDELNKIITSFIETYGENDRFVYNIRRTFESHDSLSEANSHLITNIINKIWDLDVLFFNYTDLFENRIILKECNELIENEDQYASYYNRAIDKYKLDIPKVGKNFLPLWFECDCGSKTRLFLHIDNGYSRINGRCQDCGNLIDTKAGNKDKSDLFSIYPKLSFDAVARDIICARGLGTSVYISGRGGGLKYGKISEHMRHELSIENPIILAPFILSKYASREWIGTLNRTKELIRRNEFKGLCHVNEAIVKIDKDAEMVRAQIEDLKQERERLNDINAHTSTINERLQQEKIKLAKLTTAKQNYLEISNRLTNLNDSVGINLSFYDLAFSEGLATVIQYWIQSIKENDLNSEITVEFPSYNQILTGLLS